MKRFTKLFLSGASVALMAQAANAQQALPQQTDSYFVSAQQELFSKLAEQPNTGRAKNVILFVLDGFSIPTLTAARIYEGQSRGVDGESNVLSFEKLLPYVALSKTYTHDSQVADSAPTATAMTTGVKSLNGTIGVTQKVTLENCASQKGAEAESIFELAEKAGLSTGIISTARITHATPAAAYAHTAFRDWESDATLSEEAKQNGCKDIAAQLIDWSAGNGFEVVLGGGRSNFLPESAADPEAADKTGARKDGRNLVDEWKAKYNDGAYVWNKTEFDAVDAEKTEHLFGLFERSHMQYEADRAKDKGGEPSLAEMTGKAIDVLSKNKEGFVLMVEAGRIDHAHHAGNAARALADTVAAAQALQVAYDKVNPQETLIVLTADHSHTMTINGYPKRNNPILGIAGTGDDKKPYTTLSYANGPGAKLDEPRPDLTNVDTTDLDFLQPALVPLGESETHGGDDVAIFAAGPWAHLFRGVVEQNLIYHVMAYASQLPSRVKAETTGAVK
ncbi:alkaline phosphatase [Mesorhizobium albiziae]|uniref:Alkaline phosphatase n=1 Tax=Neomesorhizobium albiziae TaxID=335020 RepID=A0A1I3VFI7_9HYPH|nr:alkaline phosphatase [Mesorhizobium albiziae]GLS28810.1 alkaline phosphatase [Mesorhizobium albiziae]SFJ92921.1 alkaline phosphatase [Mesorhizobium albiziae]